MTPPAAAPNATVALKRTMSARSGEACAWACGPTRVCAQVNAAVLAFTAIGKG
jgi:hypothetical protein